MKRFICLVLTVLGITVWIPNRNGNGAWERFDNVKSYMTGGGHIRFKYNGKTYVSNLFIVEET